MKRTLALILLLEPLHSFACDDCPLYFNSQQTKGTYIGLNARHRVFNGYDGDQNKFSFNKSAFTNAKTLHHPTGFMTVLPNSSDVEFSRSVELNGGYKKNNIQFAFRLPYQNTWSYYKEVFTLTNPITDTSISYSGIGDLSVSAFVYASKNKPKSLKESYFGGLTIKLPTGVFRYTDNQITPTPTIFEQTGTGSTDLIFSAGIVDWYPLVNMDIQAVVQYKLSTISKQQYRYGNRFMSNLTVSHRFREVLKSDFLIGGGVFYELFKPDFFLLNELEGTSGRNFALDFHAKLVSRGFDLSVDYFAPIFRTIDGNQLYNAGTFAVTFHYFLQGQDLKLDDI